MKTHLSIRLPRRSARLFFAALVFAFSLTGCADSLVAPDTDSFPETIVQPTPQEAAPAPKQDPLPAGESFPGPYQPEKTTPPDDRPLVGAYRLPPPTPSVHAADRPADGQNRPLGPPDWSNSGGRYLGPPVSRRQAAIAPVSTDESKRGPMRLLKRQVYRAN